jgi:ribosomal protein S6
MGKQPSQLNVTDLLSELTKNKPEEVQNEDSGVAQLAKKIKKLNSKNVGILHLLLVIWI